MRELAAGWQRKLNRDRQMGQGAKRAGALYRPEALDGKGLRWGQFANEATYQSS
ncbi:hypothetical protein [Paenibacillus sabinae]|uniref:hypothetical protein n=1 Tax=Paenibacillus sabinae TaxID=365617 RepID=UPI00130EFA21|nr:hypothetical protein [Paenibacillus sabinae]